MKYLIAILFSFLITYHGLAQNYYVDPDSAINDETGEFRMKYILRKEFSKVINTNTNGVIGKYVGISTKDNNLTFAYSIVGKSGVFQFNAAGGSSEGISNFISNSELNTGISLGVKYNWMFGQQKIKMNYDKIRDLQTKAWELKLAHNLYDSAYTAAVKKIKEERDKKVEKVKDLEKQILLLKKKRSDLLNGIPNTSIDTLKQEKLIQQRSIVLLEIELLNKKITNASANVAQEISRLQRIRNAAPRTTPYLTEQFKIDSLKALYFPIAWKDTLKSKQAELINIENQIKENTFDEEKLGKAKQELFVAEYELQLAEEKYNDYRNGWSLADANNKYDEDVKKNLDEFAKLRARDVKLQWFGAGISLSNEEYKLFDPEFEVEKQLYDEKDLIPTLNLSFTHYKNMVNESKIEGGRNISFFSLSAQLKLGNNIGKLSQLTIETTDSIAPNRSSVKSQKAYKGTFEDNIFTGEFACDYYRFIGTTNNFGYHIRGEANLVKDLAVASLRVGIVFAMTSQDDQKSIANFELFYGLNDVFSNGEEDSILGRNVFGIQTTIPFNFND